MGLFPSKQDGLLYASDAQVPLRTGGYKRNAQKDGKPIFLDPVKPTPAHIRSERPETVNNSSQGPGVSDADRAFRERLRWVLDRFKSRIEAAEVAGVGANQLARYLRGDADPPWDAIARLASDRGVSLDWLTSGEGPRMRSGAGMEDEGREFRGDYPAELGDSVSIPLYDVRASAGGGSVVWDERPATRVVFPRAMLQRLGVGARGAKLMLASGDSMTPTIEDGNLMLIDTTDIDLRDDVFILRREDSILVKRLQRRMDGSLSLRSDNPAYDEERLPRDEAEDLQVLARVRMAFKAV